MFISKAKTAQEFRKEVVEYLEFNIKRETNALANMKNLTKSERDMRQAVIASTAFFKEYFSALHFGTRDNDRDFVREALQFYAEPISYVQTQINEPMTAVHGDRGRKAREALDTE